MIVDVGRPITNYPLTQPIHRRRLKPSHRLFSGNIGPCARRDHQQPSFGASIEITPSGLLQGRETFVQHRDQLHTSREGLSRDLTLPVTDAGRDENSPMARRRQELIAPRPILGRLEFNNRLTARITCNLAASARQCDAPIATETARDLNLSKWCLQQEAVADR